MKRFEAVRDGHELPAFMRSGDIAAKLRQAREALTNCRLCPHECGANRLAGETGWCGVGPQAHVAADLVHLGEVPALAPAWTVFLSGCTMRCVYCRKWELLEQPQVGRVLEPRWFADRARQAQAEGARTIKLLGGTPEPHVAALLAAMGEMDARLPVIWESTTFMSSQCLSLIEGTVDLFVANLRYGNDACARELSGVPEYVAPALGALGEVMRWSDVRIRHLILPGHIDCCTRPLAAMLEEVAPEFEMELLMQYVPFWRARDYPPLDRRLTEDERRAAVAAVSEVKETWRVVDLA